MYRRIAATLLLVWILGFLWFAIALPEPAGATRTDAIIVLTGGKGRIPRGLDALRGKLAPRVLISGVDPEVRSREFEAEYDVPRGLMACCVTLGYEAYDTRSNARETADWVARNKVRSLRLVTSDSHMRRAAYEMSRVLPAGVVLVEDAVPSHPSLALLFLEYHKFLARWLMGLRTR